MRALGAQLPLQSQELTQELLQATQELLQAKDKIEAQVMECSRPERWRI